jgi:hypothetical protein
MHVEGNQNRCCWPNIRIETYIDVVGAFVIAAAGYVAYRISTYISEPSDSSLKNRMQHLVNGLWTKINTPEEEIEFFKKELWEKATEPDTFSFMTHCNPVKEKNELYCVRWIDGDGTQKKVMQTGKACFENIRAWPDWVKESMTCHPTTVRTIMVIPNVQKTKDKE